MKSICRVLQFGRRPKAGRRQRCSWLLRLSGPQSTSIARCSRRRRKSSELTPLLLQAAGAEVAARLKNFTQTHPPPI